MPERFSRERASTSSDNVTVHGEKFIEREFRDVREGVPNLASPKGVGVSGRLVIFVRSGWGGI